MSILFDQIRFLNTGYSSAATNMGIDEALMNEVKDTPILRIYGWKPAAVSVGYFQSISEEVNIERCKQDGIDIVRRMTGGGAVFHESELTYTFITRKYPQNILDSYKWICEAIIVSLRKMNFNANFVPLNDIVVNGKKVSGNAQTRRRGVLLQHGTVLLRVDVEKMFSLLKVPSEKLRDKLIASAKERVMGLETITFNKLASGLAEGFGETFGSAIFSDNLTKSERDSSIFLRDTKYSADEWNYKR